MKNSKKTLIATTMSAKSVPTPEDLGFTCSGVMSRSAYIAQEHRKNNSSMIRKSMKVTTAASIAYIATKGLQFLGDKTGRRGYYAAAALLGGVGCIGGIVATNTIVKKGTDEFTRIQNMRYGLPDYVRVWEQTDADICSDIRMSKSQLEHDMEKDGPMSVNELIYARAERVVDLLDEAGIEADLNDVVEMLENEQYSAIQVMVDSANAILKAHDAARSEEVDPVNLATVDGTKDDNTEGDVERAECVQRDDSQIEQR